jgi:hypothetical protein
VKAGVFAFVLTPRVRAALAVEVDRLGERVVLEQLPLTGRELPVLGVG